MASADWHRKSVVVCGASTGLGFEIARQLAGQDARIVMVARNAERLERARSALCDLYPQCNVSSQAADLRQASGTEQLAAWIRSQGIGPVDLLINAVGQSDRGTIMRLAPERLGELMAINVQATLLTTQNIYELLRRPGAVVVNIGSLASRFAPRYLGGYSAAKHALAAVTQQMRLELALEGIHVMLVCPGPIRRPAESTRYDDLPNVVELPAAALKAGGGTKLRGLDATRLADQILRAAARRKPELVRPSKARLLMIVAAISPSLGDYLLKKMST